MEQPLCHGGHAGGQSSPWGPMLHEESGCCHVLDWGAGGLFCTSPGLIRRFCAFLEEAEVLIGFLQARGS
jgi:hypothetical protein